MTRKISIAMLLLHLSLGISKIMLLVSVDGVVSGLLSFHAGEQGSGCSVKNVAADKSMVVIFPACLSEWKYPSPLEGGTWRPELVFSAVKSYHDTRIMYDLQYSFLVMK